MKMKAQKHNIILTIIGILVSGFLLGVSQPLYMPLLFSEGTTSLAYLGLLAFIGYVPLFLILKNSSLKRCFLVSFLAVTIQYTIALYWIYVALHVHGHIPPVSASLVTLCLPMLMALKAGLFFTWGRYVSQRFAISFLWIAPISLCALEYFRNYYIFGGFPWGNTGYSVGRVDEIAQAASLVGVYGLVFLVGVINSLVSQAIVHTKRARIIYFLSAFGLLAFVWIYGAIRLSGADKIFAPIIKVALLQGNIAQEVKASASLHRDEILDIYLDQMKKAKEQGAELVVWPESAYPKSILETAKYLRLNEDVDIPSIIGAVTYAQEQNGDYYVGNSALYVDGSGEIIRAYRKSHLVPFGEYVPWPMKGIVSRVVPGMGAFKPGVEFLPQDFLIGKKTIRIGATVCYEGIFPEISRTYKKHGADLLVNLTNDAWYGFTSAPYQHLLMYKLRAVETGLSFVRATNTGVSGWFDSFGRLKEESKLFERDVLVSDVPLTKVPTLYTSIGDIIPIICLLILVIAYILAVIPIHQFVRLRQWGKLALVTAIFCLAILGHVYYSSKQFITDESASTKILGLYGLTILLMVALLSKTKRTRSLLLIAGPVIVLVSGALIFFESIYFIAGIVFGLLIYLLAFRINKQLTD